VRAGADVNSRTNTDGRDDGGDGVGGRKRSDSMEYLSGITALTIALTQAADTNEIRPKNVVMEYSTLGPNSVGSDGVEHSAAECRLWMWVSEALLQAGEMFSSI